MYYGNKDEKTDKKKGGMVELHVILARYYV